MAQLIGSVCDSSVLTECFCPRYLTVRKHHGDWVPCVKPLFQGYIVAVTSDPRAVARACGKLPEFARILTMGDEYVPLSPEEEAWLGAFTEHGERCVPLSRGYKEGDRIVVTEGPLLGKEALIERIDRKRGTAYLTLSMCGRNISTRVGLALVSRRPQDAAAEAKRKVEDARMPRRMLCA